MHTVFFRQIAAQTLPISQDQFKFIYETLVEYTRGIDSRFPVSELANKIKERGVKDKKTKKNAYQMEYGVRQTPPSTPVPQECCELSPLTVNQEFLSSNNYK